MAEERGRSRSKEKTSVGKRIRRSLSRNRSRTEGSKVKSSKIKKMMKGLTRKSKKKKKKSDSSTTDGMSVAYSVVPESVASAPSTPTRSSKDNLTNLQLVLLLMDPSSRRFELLQLEFDSDKARVSDIIAQIPLSVTEEAIRNLSFTGVIDSSAQVMNGSVRLVDFCTGKTILVAVPEGTTAKECMKLARPILCDKKVEQMLTAGSFDVSGWKKKPTPKKPSTTAVVPPSKKGGASMFPKMVTFALLAFVIMSLDTFLKAPIQADSPLKPGSFRSKCGILGFFPAELSDYMKVMTDCTNSYLEVHNDGTVSITDAAKELDIFMKGKACEEGDDCEPGLVMKENGKVFIGKQRVREAYQYGETKTLSPWPFATEPKLKIKGFWMFGGH